MITVLLIILMVLTALFTTIQTLYLESMRLRTRDLPSLTYFKETLEPKLKMRTTEEGALTFSLWKHALLIAMGVLVLAQVGDWQPLVAFDIAEAIVAEIILMALSSYLVPQFLY